MGRAMQLEGSCHCGKVSFTVESPHPCPFNLCYCSICRKTAGDGGFAINLGADHSSLKVQGSKYLSIYHPTTDGDKNLSGRHFCSHCGSALWVYDSRCPELVHPFASAIDTQLPKPPECNHMMLASKAGWVEPNVGEQDRCFNEYPDESLAAWHQRLDLVH